MDWTPDPSVVAQTLAMLQALRDPSSHSHSAALGVLQSDDVRNPSFVLHVVYVFAHARDVPEDVRQLAGLIIKNYIILASHFPGLDDTVQSLVKRYIVSAVSDPAPSVRNTATNILGGMSRHLPVDIWGDMVETIIHNLNANAANIDCLDGSLVALKRLSEDSGEKMAMDTTRYPLTHAIPVLFSACKSSVASHRLLALEALIALLFVIFDPPPLNQPAPGSSAPPSLIIYVNEYLACIAALSTDPDPAIRTCVCQAIVLVMTSHPDTLTGSMEPICSFMLTATSDTSSNNGVAIEAAEFWSALADVITSECIPSTSDHIMIQYLLKSIPVLLSRMLLTPQQVELDRSLLAAEIAGERDVSFGQKGQGQSIYHHRSKAEHTKGGNDGGGDDDNNTSRGGDASAEWTVRKQCAGVFDNICSSGALSSDQILAIALPVAKEMLQNPGDSTTPGWVYMEAGVLIIGALAGGCSTEMEPHLPVLVPFFCQQVGGNEVAEVRSIACWVLGRYSEWCIATLFSVCDSIECDEDGGDDPVYKHRAFEPSSNCYDLALNALLPAIVDGQSTVQSAALSALTSLVGNIAGGTVNELTVLLSEDRVEIIMHQIAAATALTTTTSSNGYGIRNCLILCDLIAALCEAGGSNGSLIGSPASIPHYLPFVMHQMLNVFTDDTSVYLFPLMECVTAILAVVGMHIHVYAMPLLNRCIAIATCAVEAEQEERRHREGDSGSSSSGSFHLDFVVCAFDVIGALSECLVPSSSSSGSGSICATNFSMLLTEAGGAGSVIGRLLVASLSIQTPDTDVLQSAFALAGELFRSAFITLLPNPSDAAATPTDTTNDIIEQILSRIVYYISLPVLSIAVVSNALWATGEAMLRLRQVPGGVSEAFLGAVLPVLLMRLHTHAMPVVDYGIDRYGPLATLQTTPECMDPEEDIQIFLESLGAHENVFIQNAAICLGRIAVLNMPLFLHFLEQPSGSRVSYFDCWCSALALLSSDATERSHGFMGLLGALQAKPDLLTLVQSDGESATHTHLTPSGIGVGKRVCTQCVTDSATLLLFGTALAYRDTSDISGENTDVFLGVRGLLSALRSQLGEMRERGAVVDRRLVGIYALFRYIVESFDI